MIFYNDKHPNISIISKGKRIARFVDGVFETNNKLVIEKLKPLFRFGEGKGNKVKAKYLKYWKLKAEAEARGIKTHMMKMKDIETALKHLKK